MNNLIRTLIAGWGARKIGGGCLGTIVAFIVIYYALGTCNAHPVAPVNSTRNSFVPMKQTQKGVANMVTFHNLKIN